MFARLRIYLLLSFSILLVSSCSSPLLPWPVVPQRSMEELSDETVLSLLRADWDILKKSQVDEAARAEAYARYNKNLLLLIRRARIEYKDCLKEKRRFEPQGYIVTQTPELKKLRKLRDLYEDIVPAIDVPLAELDERATMPGLGVPVVGIVPAQKLELLQDVTPVRDRGTVRTLTAVMRFPDDEKELPSLVLYSRPVFETVKVGKNAYQLAGDGSASLELFWNLTGVKKWRFMGLLRPQKVRDMMGLSCMEQYDPNRIPIVLTHGLASDPTTFTDLVNRLLKDPDIRRNYQFWYFGYPTGLAWTISAQRFRDSVREARHRLDPQNKNKNWDRTVVIGHSMGGLITHYNQCTEPWLMLRTMLKPELVQQYLNKGNLDKVVVQGSKDEFHDMYFFEPVNAARVFYFATPHRGAPMASYSIVDWLLGFIELPQALLEESYKVITLNEDMFLANPSRFTEWFTSVNQLEEDSVSIQGLQGLTVRDVPTHSIIGDRGRGNTPKSSDGVVPYYSSHIAWGTEDIVPSGHGVQEIPETAEITRKYLLEHLRSYGIKVSPAKEEAPVAP